MPIRPENVSRYPADWKLRSRFVRFVRARGKCEWCGAKHGKPHPQTGSIVVLTTAHILDDTLELEQALSGLYGLMQLVAARDDLPVGLDDLLLLNHRAVEARRVLEKKPCE